MSDVQDVFLDTSSIYHLLHEAAKKIAFITKSNDYFVERQDGLFCEDDDNLCTKLLSNKSSIAFSRDVSYEDEYANIKEGKVIYARVILELPVKTEKGDCIAILRFYKEKHYSEVEKTLASYIVKCYMKKIVEMQEVKHLKAQKSLIATMKKLLQEYSSYTISLDDFVIGILETAKSNMCLSVTRFFSIRNKNKQGIVVADIYEEKDANMIVKTGVQVGLSKSHPDIADLIEYASQNKGCDTKSISWQSSNIRSATFIFPIIFKMQVIGAIEFQKGSTVAFNAYEIKLSKLIAKYCSIAAEYNRTFLSLERKHASNELLKDKLANKLTILHSEIDVLNLKTYLPDDIDKFLWHRKFCRNIDLCYVSFNIFKAMCQGSFADDTQLYDFIISTKKCHRNVPYHNFGHAFDTLHTMYCILKRVKNFKKTEITALMLAAFLHCVEHEGVTNQFLEQTNHPLTRLYDNDFSEHHSAEFGELLIKKSNILSNFTEEEIREIFKIFKLSILSNTSTQIISATEKLRKTLNDDTQCGSQHNRLMQMTILMGASCNGVLANSFGISKMLRENLYQESIADPENANTKNIPELEIDYIRKICLPCYDIIRSMFPSTYQLYDLCRDVEASYMSSMLMTDTKTWSVVNCTTSEDISFSNN